ncbi:MAG: hypothetical protein HQ503_06375 [Rhodospirillales bacterium]|nr:hypothetical protein [Rhodospirillales bacterium]
MAYTMENFCNDCRSEIDGNKGAANLDAIRGHLEKLLTNEDFIQEHCSPDAEVGTHELYHDEETDFLLLAHIQADGRTSPPHDHGASWAIYGQAVGWTEMTEYDRKDDGTEDGHAELEVRKKYRLEPGNAGYFASHAVHSIHFPEKSRFIRVTGTDLTKLATKRFDMKDSSFTLMTPDMKEGAAGSGSAQ